MVKRSLLGRVFTLCLVYVPNIKQDTSLDSFVLPPSENLTTEGYLNLTINFPVDISDTTSWEFYSSGPFLTQNIIQPGVLAEQVLPSLKIYLFYSLNHFLITPIYYISLSGSSQDSFTWTNRGQMTWSVSLSALTTQRDCLVSQRHRKCEVNNFLLNSFLALEVETSKNQIHFHNGRLPSGSLYGMYKVVLKRKLIEKTSGTERGENAERRFLISEIKNLVVYKNVGAKKALSNLLFLGCLLHTLVLEKTACILHQCRQKYSKTEKKRRAVTAYKVRSQRENRIIIATRKQNRKNHYLLRIHIREVRVPVKAQHLKGESEGTKSNRGADPEKLPIKSYEELKDHFLHTLNDLMCYFLDFRPLADTLKEADNIVLKARKDKGDFSSQRDMPLLNTEFKTFVAVLTATLESVLPKVLCIASVKISQGPLLLDNFHILIMRHSDLITLKFGILFSLKKEKACGHLKWKFRQELEDVRNKWTDVVLCKLLEHSQLSRQTWNSYSLLPILFALLGKQFVQKVRTNKLKPYLNANKLICETMLSLKEILLAIPSASNPLHLRTFQLLKLIISIHKLCEFDVQVRMRSGYKFILRWSNATESTG